MPSVFDEALDEADKVITEVIMSAFLINGKEYQAVYDESPQRFDGFIQYNEEYRINGTKRTLTLYRSSGYRPRVGDIVNQDDKQFIVKSIDYLDDLIVLQLE